MYVALRILYAARVCIPHHQHNLDAECKMATDSDYYITLHILHPSYGLIVF